MITIIMKIHQENRSTLNKIQENATLKKDNPIIFSFLNYKGHRYFKKRLTHLINSL